MTALVGGIMQATFQMLLAHHSRAAESARAQQAAQLGTALGEGHLVGRERVRAFHVAKPLRGKGKSDRQPICATEPPTDASIAKSKLFTLGCVLFSFYNFVMQMSFNFGAAEDLAWIRDQLRARFCHPAVTLPPALTPIGQLVKSSISGRTREAVSWGAYQRLVRVCPEWSDIACATPADIERLIGDVTFPEVKARQLRDAVRAVAASRPDFDLAFLGAAEVGAALEWLERLPGVGRKVSASTLNFSTLERPAFVIDTHVLRVLRRFGLVRDRADTRIAYDATMAMLCDWSAAGLVELHILMKRLGQIICRADRALCRHCPISRRCLRQQIC